jgi:hypothetical protein
MSDIKTYTMNELEGLSEEELFSILKLSWGYEESEPIEVIGVILVRETEYSKLYFLDRIMSFKTGKTLTYPLNDNQAKITVQAFFPPPEAREILKSQIKGTHVKANIKALNGSLTSGISLTDKMIYQVEVFANEDTSKAFHPVELLFRELAIFYYLNNNLKLAKKFILKSGKAITANNSRISDYLHAENNYFQELFKGKLNLKKKYFDGFPLEIDNTLDKKSLIRKVASFSPL